VQRVNDRYACDTYAVAQSGFDPTKIGGGVSPDAAPTRQAIYYRADAACLRVSGYTVR